LPKLPISVISENSKIQQISNTKFRIDTLISVIEIWALFVSLYFDF